MASSPLPFESGMPPLPIPREIPFAELWQGHVAQAADALAELGLADGVLDEVLQRLSAELAEIGAPAAFDLFARIRVERGDVAVLLGAATGGDEVYRRFVAAGPKLLWREYPELLRLLSLRTDAFVTSIAEMLRHLRGERAILARVFPGVTGPIRRLGLGLSDRHGGGRSVTRLDFDGATLFHKPRPLEMEAGWQAFVGWFNRQDHGLPHLMAMTTVPMSGHGWMAEAPQGNCDDAGMVARFHFRAGMLLALADLFAGTDLHGENLVACGEHPVLIDAEALFQPPSRWEADPHGLQRTEMLPARTDGPGAERWLRPGLGLPPRGVMATVRDWAGLGTDAIAPVVCMADLGAGGNVPVLGGPVDAAAHVDEIIDGFLAVHRWTAARPDLWRSDGAIARAFFGKRGRLILRATRIYDGLLREAVLPGNLCTAERRSDVFARLAAPGPWAVAHAAEIRALERLDVPYFQTDTATTLIWGDGVPLGDLLEHSPFVFARDRAARIDEAALARRCSAISDAFSRSEHNKP